MDEVFISARKKGEREEHECRHRLFSIENNKITEERSDVFPHKIKSKIEDGARAGRAWNARLSLILAPRTRLKKLFLMNI